MVRDREPPAEVPSHSDSATVHHRLLLPRGTGLELPHGSCGISRLHLLWCILLGAGQDPAEPHPGDPCRGRSVLLGLPPHQMGLSLHGDLPAEITCPSALCSWWAFCSSHTCVSPLPAGLSAAKRKFADSLNEFKFRCIGDAETDDEICIGESWALPWVALKPHSRAVSRAGRWGKHARGYRISRLLPCSLEQLLLVSPGSASAKPSQGNQLFLGLNLALTDRKGRRLPISETI